MLVDWQDIRTALVAGALLRASEWGIEWLSQRKKKRQRQPSRKRQSVIPLLFREGIRVAVISAIVFGALTYAQRPRHKDLALRAPHLVKAIVGLSYQWKHGRLPCEPKISQPYIEKIGALPREQQGQEYWAAVRWAVGEGLVEELDIRPTDTGGVTRRLKLLPLGEQFINELCRIWKL